MGRLLELDVRRKLVAGFERRHGCCGLGFVVLSSVLVAMLMLSVKS